ncbi:MAG TPA: hypothetical protein VMC84_12775 [Methanocella sp.]|uniref:hypothetical protein n=1 Tax=Methanocella sp. TaxID=2052833 RepID=UPI002C3D704B|nr:hypothetical protein [Methanocella sp.]HTY92042.1 hypothetical protein [Methanocella sp.]
MDGLQIFLNNLVLFPFFLAISLVIGGFAALYALPLQYVEARLKIKYRYIAYGLPPVIIVLWLLWEASQEYPGPMLPLINMTSMFVIYPLSAVAILPLTYRFVHPKNSWWMALLATMFAMTVSFMMHYQDAAIPPQGPPPTYVNNLANGTTAVLEMMAYAAVGYAILIGIIKILNFYKGRRAKS